MPQRSPTPPEPRVPAPSPVGAPTDRRSAPIGPGPEPHQLLREALRGRHLSPRTTRAYEQALGAFLRAHPELRGPCLPREAEETARRWLLARCARGRSCVHAVAVFTLLFGPGLRVPRQPPRPRRSVPDRATLGRLLACAPGDAARLVMALLLAGLRPGEILSLRVADLDAQGLRARPGRRGPLVLPPGPRRALHRLALGQGPSLPLFPGRAGGPLSARTVQRWLREASTRAGLRPPIPPAELRRAGQALRALGEEPGSLWPEDPPPERIPRGGPPPRALGPPLPGTDLGTSASASTRPPWH